MSNISVQPRLIALRTILRPIVRFVLAGSHTYQEFVEVLKAAFIDIAIEEMSRKTKKINVSRISVLTGIHRVDVRRIYKDPVGAATKEPLNQMQQILAKWETDPRYLTTDRRPRILSLAGPDNPFSELVYSISRNLTPGTVLFEFVRRGFVEKTPRGAKRLARADFYHAADQTEMYKFLARDVSYLLTAVEENIRNPGRDKVPGQAPNLHLMTEYDNLFVSDIPTIRRWLWEEGKAFHKRVREFLSKMDKDLAEGRGEEPAGAKAVLGAFSFTVEPVVETPAKGGKER